MSVTQPIHERLDEIATAIRPIIGMRVEAFRLVCELAAKELQAIAAELREREKGAVSAIEIDKDVLLPRKRLGRKPIYPWREMKVGDSFFVDGGRPSGPLNNMQKAGVGKFQTKKEGNGYRIWRIE